MQKRKYTQLKAVEKLILSMIQGRMTMQKNCEQAGGLSLKHMKNWSYRRNREKLPYFD